MKTIETFGDWVWVSRKAIGMTQKALADSVGCSTVMVRKIECGDRQPSEQLAALLATRLNIDVPKRPQFLRMARGLAAPAITIADNEKAAGYNVPLTVLSLPEWYNVSFIWPEDLRYYVGFLPNIQKAYTLPKTLLHPPALKKAAPQNGEKILPRSFEWLDNWQTNFRDARSPEKLQFHTYIDGSASLSIHLNEANQQWQLRFMPEDNGVRIWMTLHTRQAIEGSYIVTPGLALNNGIVDSFRRTRSCVPFLSELLMQLYGNTNGTMTWHRQAGAWQPFPVPFTRYHTAVADDLFENSSGQTDRALIVRETPARTQSPLAYQEKTALDTTWETFATGLYFERAVAISNRTPADGPQVSIDFGSLNAGQSRTVQGKFYWLEGTKDDLFALWQQDFG